MRYPRGAPFFHVEERGKEDAGGDFDFPSGPPNDQRLLLWKLLGGSLSFAEGNIQP